MRSSIEAGADSPGPIALRGNLGDIYVYEPLSAKWSSRRRHFGGCARDARYPGCSATVEPSLDVSLETPVRYSVCGVRPVDFFTDSCCVRHCHEGRIGRPSFLSPAPAGGK